MSKISKWQIADELYHSGRDLFQKGRFEEALEKLRRAEEMFRRIDARGNPFLRALENGISGLANTLFLEGQCYKNLGDCDRAVTCFETSLIHFKFEKRGPFRRFERSVREQMTSCYENLLERTDPAALDRVMKTDLSINTAYQFPFSLSPDAILIARTYELAPARHERFKAFYADAREKDAAIRKSDMRSDERSLRILSTVVWGVLGILWIFYGFMVARTLFIDKVSVF